jgi:exosortase A
MHSSLPKDTITPTAAASLPSPTAAHYSWRFAMGLLGVLLLLKVALYYETIASTVNVWRESSSYGHCFLIIPISLYLAWQRRKILRSIQPAANFWGLVLLMALSFVWLLADLVDVQLVQSLCVMAMIPALVFTLHGGTTTRLLALPLGFLFFAVPMGEFLTPLLREFAVWSSTSVLKICRIPVATDGQFFTVPGARFVIIDECSGATYVKAAVALCTLYAYLSYQGLRRRIAFVLIAVTALILSNVLRIFGVAMMAYYGEMSISEGIHHYLYGWTMFSVTMALLFWAGSFWRDRHSSFEISTHFPIKISNASLPTSQRGHSIYIGMLACAILLILAAGPLVAHWLENAKPVMSAHSVITVPDAVGSWSKSKEVDYAWQPVFDGADTLIYQTYAQDEKRIYLFLAHYSQQQQGAELINSANKLYDGEFWRLADTQSHTVTLKENRAFTVQETQIRHTSGLRKVVWHWYLVAGRTTSNPYMAKLLEAMSRFRKNHNGSAMVAIAADYRFQAEESRLILREFLRAIEPKI